MTHARITLRPTPAGLLPRIALLCVLGAATTPATGSSPDTLEAALPGVTVEASRATETNASAPFAVTIVERSPAQIATESGTSLQDVLAAVPGVWVNDRGHFALGERIIIRGAGWRSAFGVRGVMVVLDGVPLTMPDGQAFADVVEPSLIRSAEIIRGPASVFWGNAAGGVLYLQTRPADAAPALRLRGMVGGYGERHVLAESNISVGRARIAAFASHIGREGYRAHSDGSFQRAGVHARLPVGRRTLVTASAAGVIQDAQNPGGLTADQFQADPRQVDDQYISYQTGKESLQLQAILTVDHALPFGTLSASAYGVRRDLDNPLPFRYVAVDRLAGGARARLTGAPSRRLRWSVGADFGLQQDDRKNFDNASGRPSGDATLDQIEDVTNVAGYAYVSATVLPRLEVSAGMRYDAIRFAMDDHFLENGDESGARRFRAASPSLGVGYRLGTALLFANVSTAFDVDQRVVAQVMWSKGAGISFTTDDASALYRTTGRTRSATRIGATMAIGVPKPAMPWMNEAKTQPNASTRNIEFRLCFCTPVCRAWNAPAAVPIRNTSRAAMRSAGSTSGRPMRKQISSTPRPPGAWDTRAMENEARKIPSTSKKLTLSEAGMAK